ncbi:MAG: TonB-dependent receptor plug domain-containing protein, partial [Longimicrobiales bacterium]
MRSRVPGWCRRAVLGVAFAIGVAFASSSVAAQDAGRVIGRAVEAESSRGLEGASVTLRGTSWSAVTDASGRFVLPRVPAGEYTAVLEYIGREPQTVDVTVRQGETSMLELVAPIAVVGLEGITAVGARALTQAEALNRQKNAANIVNIVASDQIGRFPDASAPEAVQRLPGVAVARDQGEGRYIQIRGGSPANTQVSFNGIQVPSPEGDERQIALDAVPVDVLESIEVAKATLPNMDADAIGGAVNLVTRKAPAARMLSLELAGGYATIRDEPAGSGALTFGDRTSDGLLGFLLSGSYSHRNFGSDDIEPSYDLGDPGLADDALEGLEVRHYTLSRGRFGGTATLDYRPNENNALVLGAIYSELRDEEQRRIFLHAVEDEELAFLHKNRRESLRTYSLALTGEHLRPGGARFDYRLAWTRSLEDTPFDTEIEFVQESVSFSPDLGNGDEIETNPQPGAIDGSYPFNAIQPASSDTRDTDLVGSVDLTLPYQAGSAWTGNVKLGVKLRDKTKLRDITEEEFELGDGADPIMLGQGVGTSFGGRLSSPASYGFP